MKGNNYVEAFLKTKNNSRLRSNTSFHANRLVMRADVERGVWVIPWADALGRILIASTFDMVKTRLPEVQIARRCA